MNKEEINERIEVCKKCEMSYREVGNTKRADKFNEEIHKWEKLLSDLDLLNERKINELLEYKRGYYKQKEVIDKAKNKSIELQNKYGYILDDLTYLLMTAGDSNE